MTPTTRALVAAARAGLDPDPAAAARVRAKLDLALAAPAAAPAATAGLALKLAVVAAIAGAVAVVAIPSRGSRASAVPAPRLDEIAVVETPAVRVHAAAPESVVLAPSAVSPAAVASSPRSHAPAATAVLVSGPAHEEPATARRARSGEVDLAREVQLIDRAMAALRAGHADDALAAIAIYHRETGDRGQLTEDATAIDIEASCTLHLDVTAKLAAFDHTWPSSAQRSRLTTACNQ